MERENRSNGNQEESKEGRKEKALKKPSGKKQKGTPKASPKFLSVITLSILFRLRFVSALLDVHPFFSRWANRVITAPLTMVSSLSFELPR
jgi:hypothetical protein